jgi:hypothetical protein
MIPISSISTPVFSWVAGRGRLALLLPKPASALLNTPDQALPFRLLLLKLLVPVLAVLLLLEVRAKLRPKVSSESPSVVERLSADMLELDKPGKALAARLLP